MPRQKQFSIPLRSIRKASYWLGVFLLAAFLVFSFFVYFPANPFSMESIEYTVEKGKGTSTIVGDLEKLGLVRSGAFVKFYLGVSLKYHTLKAGKYSLSPRMSAYQITKKLVDGDIVKKRVTIIEGWRLEAIAGYFEEQGLCSADAFMGLAARDYSGQFDFLHDKPKGMNLEGYLFPDTYEVSEGDMCEDILPIILNNFGKRLTVQMRADIAKQRKSIFEVVTMASIIEKEVRTKEDKALVSGVLWKRLSIGMPLQVDASINYITGKSDPGATIRDTQIDSPYNTYKYPGLPKGPIASPGFDSLAAAIYPQENPYLYYLSNGKTYFSRTHEEHVAAKQLYLR